MPDELRRNTSPDFVGLAQLKRQQADQLARFERLAAHDDWRTIHSDHYDWWMFPIDEHSQHGAAYIVYPGDIADLKQDAAYVRSYLRGVELLALAWGWDLKRRTYVEHPAPGQTWSNWPIRLYKAARSLQLFGFTEEFESLRAFALDLIRRKQSLRYGRDDLALLFTEGRPRRT